MSILEKIVVYLKSRLIEKNNNHKSKDVEKFGENVDLGNNNRNNKHQVLEIECVSIIDEIGKANVAIEKLLKTDDYIYEYDYQDLYCGWNNLAAEVNDRKRKLKRCKNYYRLMYANDKFQETIRTLKESIFLENKEYLSIKIKEGYELIGNIEGRPLDAQQMAAVVKNPDNHLIIAGAGTGKTTTIIGKVKYLLYTKSCTEKDILVLSFTNAAASEMKERLSRETNVDITVSTFHRLGLNIIRKVDGKAPFIYTENTVNFIYEQLCNRLNVDEYRALFIKYLLYYQTNQKSEFEFTTSEEYQEFLEVNPPITINGEEVKSYGEMEIANCLARYDIGYEYEPNYIVDTRTEAFDQYQPDFFLPEYGIYIEYYGINKNGEVPPFFEGKNGRSATESYQEGIEWKRTLHKVNNTILIECFAYENFDGVLIENLVKKLKDYEVDLNPVSFDELLAKISYRKNRILYAFSELLQTIITLAKNNHYSIEDLYKIATVPGIKNQRILIQLLEPIFDSYQKMLDERGAIDFSDMVNRATEYIKSGKYQNNYRYIIIDEYQDISKAQYLLLKALRKSFYYKLFCVGDDWQSIYRFAGSDIGYILNFENYWGATETSKIETTYRFSQKLIDVSSNFISKNPNQIVKQLKSKSSYDSYVIGEIEGYNEQLAIKFMIERLKDLPKNSSVFLIGRYQFDIEPVRNNSDFNVNYDNGAKAIRVILKCRSDLQISFYTAHRSKGLQSDYVFIINNRSRAMGFPSKIQNPLLVEKMLEKSDNYKFGEERRLFYVALTRARKKVYLVTIKNNLSAFAKEIKNAHQQEIKKEAFSCPICSAPLVKHKGKYGDFFGCSNYRENGCKYTRKIYVSNNNR